MTSSKFTQDLLAIAPRSVLTIPDHLHRRQIESHESTLARGAEIIRQELVSVGTLASNYADSARKAYVVLEAIISHLLGQLQRQESTSIENEVKQEGDAENERGEGTLEVPNTRSDPHDEEPTLEVLAVPARSQCMTHVPDAIITEVLEVHVCYCSTCNPSFENEVSSKLRETLKAEGEGELRGQERQDVASEVRAKCVPIAREQALQRVYRRHQEQGMGQATRPC